jgi:hypothetical protein
VHGHLEFLYPSEKIRSDYLLELLDHGHQYLSRLDCTGKLIRIGIEIPLQRLRLDPKRRNECSIIRQPNKFSTIRKAVLRGQIGDLDDGEPFGNRQRMEQHVAIEQHRENLRRSHARIQFILACMNLPIGRLEFSKKDKEPTVLDQPFSLKQHRDMLKRRTVRDHDDF